MKAQRILFGEWRPDLPDTQGAPTSDLDMAYNVYSSSTGYAPFPEQKRVSADTPSGESINELFVAQDKAEVVIFAGTDKHIYKQNDILLRTGGSIQDVSRASGYTTSQQNWKMLQFGKAVLATNGIDKIQRYLLGDGGLFTDITSSPVCRSMAVVRDFVVAGYCQADGDDDKGIEPYTKVQWSDLNNENDWVSSDANQADFQTLPSGGEIKAVLGGEFGLVLQDKAVTRMSYVGTPLIWQFDQISDNTGCLSGSSAITHNGIGYWLSESGFVACDGSTVTPIGEGKINDWFFNQFDQTQAEDISVAVDPLKSLIVWNYPRPDKLTPARGMMFYNYETNRWSTGVTEASVVAELATQGRTLDSLDPDYPVLDDMPMSLDSKLFIGGKFAFCGAVGAHVVTFDLIPTDCYLTTNDLEFGMFSVATLAQPIIENGSANFQITSRNKLDGLIAFGSPSVTSAENRADLRSGGRYHRLRVNPTGAWTKAVGFDLTVTPQGER
jgi:hypothetical protein